MKSKPFVLVQLPKHPQAFVQAIQSRWLKRASLFHRCDLHGKRRYDSAISNALLKAKSKLSFPKRSSNVPKAVWASYPITLAQKGEPFSPL